MARYGQDKALLEVAARLVGEATNELTKTATADIHIAVCGAHMSGMPLNPELTQRGSYLVARTRTSPNYRLYALSDGKRPGLARVSEGGKAIEVEVWALPSAELGGFLKTIAPPLAIGSVELVDDRWVNGFVGDTSMTDGAKEITEFGGWRSYVQSL